MIASALTSAAHAQQVEPEAEPARDEAQQDAPPPQPPMGPIATPPDVVRLRDGGIVRGTISELVADAHVDLVLLTGEVRRIPMSDVEWAGPNAEMPGQAPAERERREPPEPEDPPDLRLALTGTQPNVAFYLVDGPEPTDVQRLCVAPCETTLAPGSYSMALGIGDEAPVRLGDMVHVEEDGALVGDYGSNTGVRVAGWVTIAVGAIVGLSMFAVGISQSMVRCDSPTVCTEVSTPDNIMAGAGLGIVVGTAAFGAILAVQDDSAEIRVMRD